MAVLQAAEEGHVFFLAVAEQYELQRPPNQLGPGRLQNIEALLGGEAGDHGQDRQVTIPGQAELVLQGQLVLRLACWLGRAVGSV